MKIDNLTLMNFRNYESLNISFGDLNIIYGLNGSGKTNIIEAIYTLALTKSFRINNDKVMIKKGKIKAKIKGNVFKKNDENEFGVEISNEGKIVTINGEKQDKVSDYVSRINVILFNPSDTRLIDEAPSERRKLLNIEISQIYKEYLVTLANYQKILKQRNFYLRGMYVNGNYTSTYLDILTKKLIEYGSVICKYRENFIDNINKYITSNYEKIFGSGTLKVRYVSTFKKKDDETLFYKLDYESCESEQIELFQSGYERILPEENENSFYYLSVEGGERNLYQYDIDSRKNKLCLENEKILENAGGDIVGSDLCGKCQEGIVYWVRTWTEEREEKMFLLDHNGKIQELSMPQQLPVAGTHFYDVICATEKGMYFWYLKDFESNGFQDNVDWQAYTEWEDLVNEKSVIKNVINPRMTAMGELVDENGNPINGQ